MTLIVLFKSATSQYRWLEDFNMKAKFIIAIGCLSILLSGYAYARCGCGGYPPKYCEQPTNPCDCADNGWKWNTCMSKSKYCEAYGNIGKIDD
jgi:hypothetical protein